MNRKTKPSAIFLDPHIGAGNEFTAVEALSLISLASNAPKYSFQNHHFGYGMVGGYLSDVESNGQAVADNKRAAGVVNRLRDLVKKGPEWAWDFPYVNRSLKPMVVKFGRITIRVKKPRPGITFH